MMPESLQSTPECLIILLVPFLPFMTILYDAWDLLNLYLFLVVNGLSCTRMTCIFCMLKMIFFSCFKSFHRIVSTQFEAKI